MSMNVLNLVCHLTLETWGRHMDLGEASLPESKAWDIVARARHLSFLHILSCTQVSQLMGSLNWASGLIPLGHLYLRPIQRHFHSLGLTDRFTPPCRSDPLVLANLLRRWQDPRFLTSGIPLRTFHVEFTIFTDASTQGWGAHMGDSQISGTWTHTDRKLHISCLELKALFHALQHWAQMLQGHQVIIATDNSTVVSYINKQGGGPFPHLVAVDSQASPLVRGSEHNSPSKTYTRLSERDSRPPISSEPANSDRVVPPPRDSGTYCIFRVWGTPEVDMFATLSNSHLPRFMSPIPELRALAVDALSQDWQGMSMYMFPPFPLLNKVMQKLRSTQVAEVILVVPWWLSQSWFPHLPRLCVEHPLVLPYRRDFLSQQDQKYISDGKSYHLHVWRLSCNTIKQQAFQTRSLGSRQPLGGPQPIACTMIDGFHSLDGPRDKVLIHLRLTARVVLHRTISDMIASMEA